MIDPLLQITLIAVLLTAVATDIRSYRIPNWLTMPAMAGGLLIHTLLNGQAGLILSLEGLGLGLGLFLIFYLMGGMGAGDVKLMAAVGSFLGPRGVLYAAMLTGLLGGVYAVAAMASCWGLRATVQQIVAMLTTLSFPQEDTLSSTKRAPFRLRYALVISLGTLLSMMANQALGGL
jgi:prepilin peptidase CpaA